MTNNIYATKRGTVENMPRLLGERLCLDFVNTIEGPISDHPEEYLKGYEDVLIWGQHVELWNAADTLALQQALAHDPEQANALYLDTVRLRSLLYRIFQQTAYEADPNEQDINALHAFYLDAIRAARLDADYEGWSWQWNRADPYYVLWCVVASAMKVLQSGEGVHVKECRGIDDCGWLFLDTSKNHSRQWCSMEGCGSRVKMRRQYAKRQNTKHKMQMND